MFLFSKFLIYLVDSRHKHTAIQLVSVCFIQSCRQTNLCSRCLEKVIIIFQLLVIVSYTMLTFLSAATLVESSAIKLLLLQLLNQSINQSKHL